MKSEFQIAYLQTVISALCFGKLWFAVSHFINKCNSIFLSMRKQGIRRLWHTEQWTTCLQILMGTVPFLLESLIPYLADACLLSRPLYLLQIHQFEMLLYSILTGEQRLFTERKKHLLLVSDHVTLFLSRFYVRAPTSGSWMNNGKLTQTSLRWLPTRNKQWACLFLKHWTFTLKLDCCGW